MLGVLIRGISEAREGRREAHRDVLVAVPRINTLSVRSRLQSLQKTSF